MNYRIKGNIMLILTAFIWGNGFIAQSVGMDYIGPYTFLCIRGLLGGITLLPCIYFFNRHKINKTEVENNKKILFKSGILCGIFVFIANVFQQFGIMYTSVGKSGFITALYIIIVPILGIFLKKKVKLKIWISVMVATIGLYLLCLNESLSINKGDVLTLICAFFFSIQILLVDHYSPLVDSLKFSCIQFFVSGGITAVPMFIFEDPQIANILLAYKPLLYSGILSFGVAYTLQIIGQKYTEASIASLLMSFESVFAALGGWIILGETLSRKEILGATLMFSAVILTQISRKNIKLT